MGGTPHKNAPNTIDSDLFVVKQQHHRDTPNAGPFLEIYSLLEDMDFSFDTSYSKVYKMLFLFILN